MLRFIVLGEIPGTHIYLSFLQVLLLLGAMYWAIFRHLKHRQRRPHPPEDIAL